MDAIGTLAGGIAHDFNNILTPIIMGAQMVLETLPEQHRARLLTQKIVTAGERAKDLVSQILTFSRQSDLKKAAHVDPACQRGHQAGQGILACHHRDQTTSQV
jgi:signal transduction histidine kinase